MGGTVKTIEFEKVMVEVTIKKEIEEIGEGDDKEVVTTRTIASVSSDGNDCGEPGREGGRSTARFWNVYGNDEGHLMVSIVEDTDW